MNNLDSGERLDIIRHKLKFIEEAQKPQVLFLSALNPPVFESTEYLDAVCRTAGGRPYHGEIEDGSKKFNPDVIVVFAYDKSMEIIFEDLIRTLSLDEWQNTAAVKKNRIFLIEEACQLKSEPDGQVDEDDVELLAEILYPQQFIFGMEGECWIRLEL